MGRINNTTKYPLDSAVTLGDQLFGTNIDSVGRESRNYSVKSLIRLLSEINGGANNNFLFDSGSTIPESGSFTTNSGETNFDNITNIRISNFNSDGISVESYLDFILENRDLYLLTLEQEGNLDNLAFIEILSFIKNEDYFNITVNIPEGRSSGSLFDGSLFNFKINLKSSAQPLNRRDFNFDFVESNNPFEATSLTFSDIVNQDTRTLVSGQGDIPRFIFRIYTSSRTELPKVYGFSLLGLQEGVFGVNGNRTLTQTDLIFEFERIPSAEEIEDDPSTQLVSFPDISTTIEEWLNLEDPFLTLQPEGDGLVIFRGLINSEPRSFLFIGERGNYGVGSGNTAAESDFEPLEESITVDTSGDMAKLIYDPQTIESDAFNRANHTGQETTDNIEDDAITEPKLSPEVRTKLNESIGAGGYAGNVYYTNLDSSTVGTYKQLSYEDDTSPTIIDTVVNNNEVLIQDYIFDGDVLTDKIASGLWVFNTFCEVGATQGITKIRHEVFARTAGGVETVLFSVETDELNNTSYEMVTTPISKPSYVVNPTDRLGVKLYANTTRTSNLTVSVQIGNGNASYLTAPLQIRHNQLRGRNEPDQHEISAITGLQTELDSKEIKYSSNTIDTSRNIVDAYRGETLIIDGTVTLTFSGTYATDLNFNILVKAGSTLTIANGDKILLDGEQQAQTQIVVAEKLFVTVLQFAAGEYIVLGL